MIRMLTDISFTLNGHVRSLSVAEDDLLLDILRNHLRLTGTRFGCGEEACGACMVVIDGKARHSCTTLALTVDGALIQTVEGLAEHDALVQAFVAEQAGQCGYCLSGILMSASALLDSRSDVTRSDIVAALEPHLCRCGAHPRIISAIEKAVAMRRRKT
jgi:nicotinate dehydrogenase subunit A